MIGKAEEEGALLRRYCFAGDYAGYGLAAIGCVYMRGIVQHPLAYGLYLVEAVEWASLGYDFRDKMVDEGRMNAESVSAEYSSPWLKVFSYRLVNIDFYHDENNAL
jgi:hypothetical protein